MRPVCPVVAGLSMELREAGNVARVSMELTEVGNVAGLSMEFREAGKVASDGAGPTILQGAVKLWK